MGITIFILALVCVFAFFGIFFSILKFAIILSAISLIIFGVIMFGECIRNFDRTIYTPIIIILVGIVLLKLFLLI